MVFQWLVVVFTTEFTCFSSLSYQRVLSRHALCVDLTVSPHTPADLNGDGFITQPEMEKYLASLFRVMYTVNPEWQAVNDSVDPATLAHVTAVKVRLSS